MEKLRSLLVNMPDLVRGLTRSQYGKVGRTFVRYEMWINSMAQAQPTELATVLVGLARVGSEFKPNEGDVFKSALLNNVLKTLPTIKDPARVFLDSINLKEARENDEANLWVDSDKYPDLQDAKDVSGFCISTGLSISHNER
jgi:DNA mismatch repair protein MSH3